MNISVEELLVVLVGKHESSSLVGGLALQSQVIVGVDDVFEDFPVHDDDFHLECLHNSSG